MSSWSKSWCKCKRQRCWILIFEHTPLHYAAKNDDLSLVEYLLHQGADFQDGYYLHWAVKRGHLGVVEYLVNHKADVNAKDEYVVFLYFIGLLFFWLLKRVILLLLNLYFIMVLIFEMDIIFIGLLRMAILVLLSI